MGRAHIASYLVAQGRAGAEEEKNKNMKYSRMGKCYEKIPSEMEVAPHP